MMSKIEDWIIAHVGTRTSFVLHVLWFSYWIITPVEQFPFGLLTMVVSLEAILLSILIMLSQRRHDILLEAQSAHDKRVETDKLDAMLGAFEELFTHLPKEFESLRRAVDTGIVFERFKDATNDKVLHQVALEAAVLSKRGAITLSKKNAKKTSH